MATSDQLTDRLRELHRSLYAVPEVSEPPKSILRIFGSTRSEQQRNTLLAYFSTRLSRMGSGQTCSKPSWTRHTRIRDGR